jgi:predicted nuclease of predicted toxin-antitoxin system
MADRIRFHLDEHVDPAIANALRRAGIDVTTTIEAGLRTKGDEEHLRFARNEGRVIVT